MSNTKLLENSDECGLKETKCGEKQMKTQRRPVGSDICLIENEYVYASNTLLGGSWVGALFSKIDIKKGESLCKYTGKILTQDEEAESSSQYLMKVRNPLDLRRKLVIDGDPRKFSNIAGYANYSKHQYANAYFVDKTHKNGECNIILIAKEFIPQGVEIRVDYDMGSAIHPFRDMMIKENVYVDDDHAYKNIRWCAPSCGFSIVTT